MFLIPTFAVTLVVAARRSVGLRPVAAAALLPAVIIAPWLISNDVRLGTWTANAAARAQQAAFLFPGGAPRWSAADLPGRLVRLPDGVLPQEWTGQLDVWWVGLGARAMALGLVVAAIYGVIGRRTNTRADQAVRFFALPAVAAVAMMGVTLLAGQWDIFLLRYMAPVLAPLAIAVAAQLQISHARALTYGAVIATVLAGLLWVEVSGAYLFTDIGGALGIRPIAQRE